MATSRRSRRQSSIPLSKSCCKRNEGWTSPAIERREREGVILNAASPQRQLGAALGRIPSGLFILTARRGEAENGMLVSWVQQCSFKPPALSVALHSERVMAAWLTTGTCFTLNILDEGQRDMIAHFGRTLAPDDQPFANLDVQREDSAGPVLSASVAFLDCRVMARCPAGEHELLVAEIVGGRVLSDGRPLVHMRKSGLHY